MITHYHCSLWNHTPKGRETLYDVQDAIACQLKDLGFTVTQDQEKMATVDRVMNVIFECFDVPTKMTDLKRIRSKGGRFLLVFTERPGKRVFNDYGPDSSLYLGMMRRQQFAPEACELADGVLCLVPGASRWVQQYQRKAVDVELGFSFLRLSLLHRPGVEPKHHYSFFGGHGERRMNILRDFSRRGAEVAITEESYGERSLRDDVVRSAQVALGINPKRHWQLFSNSRAATAIHLGRPLVQEYVDADTPYREIIRIADKGRFWEVAEEVRDNWREEYQRQLKALSEKLPPTACVGMALKHFGLM